MEFEFAAKMKPNLRTEYREDPSTPNAPLPMENDVEDWLPVAKAMVWALKKGGIDSYYSSIPYEIRHSKYEKWTVSRDESIGVQPGDGKCRFYCKIEGRQRFEYLKVADMFID